MIVLVQPMYSKQELNADSNYVIYTQLVRGMLEVRPGWHFYVIFPDDKSGYKYEPDGFFRLPNVTRIPQRVSPRKLANAIQFDAMWWDKLYRHLAFDVVWANLIEAAGAIKFAGQAAYGDYSRPVIIGAHNYVMHDSLPYAYDAVEHVAIAQIVGAIHSDLHVFNSDYCQLMFFENAARYLNNKVLDKLHSTARRIDMGVLEESLQPTKRNNSVPIIAYNHRLQAYKNFDKTFKVLDRLYQSGIKFEVWYINNTAEKSSKILSYEFVRMKLCATRPDYLATLRQCDLNVTNSQYETFCISAIESMAVGHPLVAPLGTTFPEITGRATNNYPYLFRNEGEQSEMLKTLLTDKAEREKWGGVLSKHVRKAYNNRLWAERYATLFESIDFGAIPSEDDAKAMVLNKLRDYNGATVKEALARIFHAPVNGRQPFSSQSLTPVKFIRLARELGARISVEEGQQRIRLL
jgi:glycosyltransferase involved in cell wall biosynthesis